MFSGRIEAEAQKADYIYLKKKLLVHAQSKTPMHVVDLSVQKVSGQNKFSILCRLRGEEEEKTETLDAVLKDYAVYDCFDTI